MAGTYFKIDGIGSLRKDLIKLGKTPQKNVGAAAKKGMKPIITQAKANAPYDTGNLKKGTIMVGEKSKPGKKVYRIVFDRNMDDVFRKTAANATHTVTYHGHSRRTKDIRQEANTSYYPVSQEYGYFTKNGRYIPGFKFVHNSLYKNVDTSKQIMIKTMTELISLEAKNRGLK